MSTLHKDHRDVLIAPVVSEKSYGLLDANKYTFLVRPDANKTEIKVAVEKLFDVTVEAVNVVNVKGKQKAFKNRMGRRADWRKAYVKLADGQSIDVMAKA